MHAAGIHWGTLWRQSFRRGFARLICHLLTAVALWSVKINQKEFRYISERFEQKLGLNLEAKWSQSEQSRCQADTKWPQAVCDRGNDQGGIKGGKDQGRTLDPAGSFPQALPCDRGNDQGRMWNPTGSFLLAKQKQEKTKNKNGGKGQGGTLNPAGLFP